MRQALQRSLMESKLDAGAGAGKPAGSVDNIDKESSGKPNARAKRMNQRNSSQPQAAAKKRQRRKSTSVDEIQSIPEMFKKHKSKIDKVLSMERAVTWLEKILDILKCKASDGKAIRAAIGELDSMGLWEPGSCLDPSWNVKEWDLMCAKYSTALKDCMNEMSNLSKAEIGFTPKNCRKAKLFISQIFGGFHGFIFESLGLVDRLKSPEGAAAATKSITKVIRKNWRVTEEKELQELVKKKCDEIGLNDENCKVYSVLKELLSQDGCLLPFGNPRALSGENMMYVVGFLSGSRSAQGPAANGLSSAHKQDNQDAADAAKSVKTKTNLSKESVNNNANHKKTPSPKKNKLKDTPKQEESINASRTKEKKDELKRNKKRKTEKKHNDDVEVSSLDEDDEVAVPEKKMVKQLGSTHGMHPVVCDSSNALQAFPEPPIKRLSIEQRVEKLFGSLLSDATLLESSRDRGGFIRYFPKSLDIYLRDSDGGQLEEGPVPTLPSDSGWEPRPLRWWGVQECPFPPLSSNQSGESDAGGTTPTTSHTGPQSKKKKT